MRVILAGAAVAVLVTGIFLVRPGPVAKADDKACDLLTGSVSRGKPSGKITIVEIDDASLAQLGRWPWPRDLLATVVRRILDRGAATVVLDMMFHDADSGMAGRTGRSAPQDATTNDDALAAAITGKPVVIGYVFRFDGSPSAPTCLSQPLPLAVVGPNGGWTAGFFHAAGALCSVPQLARAAAGGFLNGSPDSDGKLRRIPVVIESGDRQYPSLALEAFRVYRHASAMQLTLNAREAASLRVGSDVVRLEGPSSMRLRFRGARRTFPYVSIASVMDDRAPTSMLAGKIAIVGGSALGLPHPVATPVDPQLPDLEVEATAIDNLLQGDAFNRPAGFRISELFIALLAGLAAAILLEQVRSWWGPWFVLGAGAVIWAGCILLLSTTGLLLSPLPATAALACVFPIVTLLNFRTERRRAETSERQLAVSEQHTLEVMREGEARYQRLVENINDAIIVNDAEGRLVFANRRFREWFGLEARDIREVILEDYVAPEWRARVRERHDRRMRGESVSDHFEFEGIRPGGTRIWIEALVTNLEEKGRRVGTQAALRDVTERKRIEAQYLQAQKMEGIGRMAGSVAHDFNNLLTVINGYSDLLLSRRRDEMQTRADLMAIRAAGGRAAELTRNLLAFSRKQMSQPTAVDLNVVVGEAEKMFGRLIGEDIELSTRLGPNLGPVMADPGQMHQILMNLLVNARDAMPSGGKVVIETKNVDGVDGPFVCLSVADSGTGMTEEVKEHLFEPFFTTKEPGKGTGLGLATVYGIVRQCAGRIEVSSNPGEGTTVHIYLPRAQAGESAHPGGGTRAAVPKGSETILLVEDQEAVRQYIREVLENSGYRVLEAANGPDALAMAEQFSGTIHLLLSDVVLPLMNGRDVAVRLKQLRPGLRVMFTSGYTGETVGDLAYLPKPFTPDVLSAKVREVLGTPGLGK